MNIFEIKDYRALLKYGDIKKLCVLTGLTPYLIKTRLEKQDEETIMLVKTFYDKKLEFLKTQINDYSEV